AARSTQHAARSAQRATRSVIRIFIALLAFSIAQHSVVLAQDLPQTAPAITFHVFQHVSSSVQKALSKDSALAGDGSQGCCGIEASVTVIPSCGQPLVRPGKETPQDVPCCCVDVAVWSTYPKGCFPLCGCDIAFDDQNFNPLCSVCSLPPGWSYSLDDPEDGIIHLTYSGSGGCNGALSNNQTLHFQFCGVNTAGEVGYTITGYECTTDPETGKCVKGPAICSPHFNSELNCSMAVVSNSDRPSLVIDNGSPNPTSSSIRFGFTSPTSGPMSMTIVDILGHNLSESTQYIAQGNGGVTISLGNIQPGAYFCVFTINGETLTRRIVVK
ncbi:MAG: T9SS type A sorting domain-containing protein, partial [Rhabdochlamydiaceae bacterium]